MSSAEILKSFVVSLGWQHDEVAARKVFDQVSKIEKGLTSLVVGAEAAAIGVVAALGKMAEGFERAYYASSRSGSAVRELNAFRYAASQTGSTAEEAASAVDGLAQKIRENRGFRNLVQGLTGDKSSDVARQITELGAVFSRMSSEQAHATAAMLGIPEHLLLALQSPEFQKFQEEYRAKAQAMGVDLQKAAEDGKNLTRSLRSVRETLGLIVDSADSPLFQQLDAPLKRLNDFLVANGKQIGEILGRIAAAFVTIVQKTLELLPEADKLANAMGGWETVFAGLAAVISVAFVGRIASLFGSLRGLSLLAMPPWLLTLLGVGAAAKIGGDAAKGVFDKGFDAVAGGATPEQQANRDMGVIDRAKKLWNERPSWLGGPVEAKGGTAVNQKLPPEARALLDTISSGEAHGYNVINGGGTFHDYSRHPYAGLSTNQGGRAAGRYQDLPSTWAAIQRETGITDFSPESQDKGNWWLAQRDYKARTGRDLLSDLRSKDPARLAEIGQALRPTWVSIGGGFGRKYDAYHARIEAGPIKAPPMVRDPKPGEYVPKHDGSAVPIPAIKGIYPGEADHPAFNPSIAAPPLGSHTNDNSRAVTVIDQSKTTVNGVSDPQKAADHIGRIGDRQQSLLLRNMAGAVG